MKKKASLILLGCLLIAVSFLIPDQVFAQSAGDETSGTVKGITAGRAKSLVGGVLALVSLVVGWRANKVGSGMTSPTRNKRTQATIALSLGGIAIILSLIHLSTSAGAVFGSGSGKAGAIVALVLALIGASLGGLSFRKVCK
jgi:peptidoglycan/LPS O-acetylase OafA/YrhL